MYDINRKRLIKTFTELAEISSPSWNEKEVMKYIIRRLNRLGGECSIHSCGESSNLLIRIKGKEKRAPILLSGHMDTVIPCDNVKTVVTDTRISSDGRTVLGSDDKAAIAAFIEAFEHIKENRMQHGPVEILLTCAEEQGLKGIKGFDLSLLNSKYGFVFDSSGAIGRIVVKAPYHSNMVIEIKGKASHAGMAPEKGISAIRVLSEIITALPSGRIDEDTTINVGIISGGRATNIVAEEARCELEVRSIDKKRMLEVEKEVRETVKKICTRYRAKSSITRTLEYGGFKISPEEPVSVLTAEAMKKIGIKPRFVSMGGGSDTNIINGSKIKAINLACGMQKIHSTEEFILIKDLIACTKLTLSIIETVR
ncbi:MAG TPA: M20/M25/M40 family metallo-hydrolase [Spirochaetota bacterium]|nr:M20/M25/M40 family metallo-hydrolase [Spirochaetota bacterium]